MHEDNDAGSCGDIEVPVIAREERSRADAPVATAHVPSVIQRLLPRFRGSKYQPHQGKRERERRLRQIEQGTRKP